MNVRNEKPPLFVLYSTKESVEHGIQSSLAWLEVLIAASAYWLAAIYYYKSAAVLFLSACVSLVLLLRSDQSVNYGVELFEKYVDSVLWERDLSSGVNYFSKRFIFSIAIGTATNAGGVFAFAYLSSVFGAPTDPVVRGMLIAYFAVVLALAMVTACAATELILVAEQLSAAILVALCILTAGTIAAFFAGIDFMTFFGMLLTSTVLVLIGLWSAPLVLSHGRHIARQQGKQNVTTMTALQAVLEGAPKLCLILTVGVFIGGWFRSICTRVIATVCYLPEGIRSIPFNWRRTLLVQDVLNIPEIIPGYRRDDMVNTSYAATYIWNRRSSVRYVYFFYFIILILPAYAYRLCIKSTFWAYSPLVYISREYKYDRMPKLVADYVQNSPLERFARIFSAATIIGMLYFTTYGYGADFLKRILAINAISPLEYLLLIDLTKIKPWQWFSVSGAIVTFAIFYLTHKMTVPLRHLIEYPTLEREVQTYCTAICKLIQLRNCLSIAFIATVIVHAALNVALIQQKLNSTAVGSAVLRSARWFYGGSLP
jgi:hypothetical protein